MCVVQCPLHTEVIFNSDKTKLVFSSQNSRGWAGWAGGWPICNQSEPHSMFQGGLSWRGGPCFRKKYLGVAAHSSNRSTWEGNAGGLLGRRAKTSSVSLGLAWAPWDLASTSINRSKWKKERKRRATQQLEGRQVRHSRCWCCCYYFSRVTDSLNPQGGNPLPHTRQLVYERLWGGGKSLHGDPCTQTALACGLLPDFNENQRPQPLFPTGNEAGLQQKSAQSPCWGWVTWLPARVCSAASSCVEECTSCN